MKSNVEKNLIVVYKAAVYDRWQSSVILSFSIYLFVQYCLFAKNPSVVISHFPELETIAI